jgi:hypothetical protein
MEELMIKKRIIAILSIAASVLIASCIGFIAWKILELVYPHKSVLEFSLDAIGPDYDLPRWAVGSVVFGLFYLSMCYLWDKSLMTQSLKKTGIDFASKPLWIGIFSLRIVFSLYLVSFWSNYVFYMWFSNINLMIGGLGNDFLVRQGCIVVSSLLGMYIILAEPLHKLSVFTSSRFLGTAARIVSIIFISINFYLLSLTGFPGNIISPILIALFFPIAYVIIMTTLKTRANDNKFGGI